MDVEAYWRAVLEQDAEAIRSYFDQNAYVHWHNTNEHFNVEEFIRANCEYPGDWDGRLERTEHTDSGLLVTVAHVWSKDGSLSFHVTSFIHVENDRIYSVDEYWGDDGPAPEWRRDLGIGSGI